MILVVLWACSTAGLTSLRLEDALKRQRKYQGHMFRGDRDHNVCISVRNFTRISVFIQSLFLTIYVSLFKDIIYGKITLTSKLNDKYVPISDGRNSILFSSKSSTRSFFKCIIVRGMRWKCQRKQNGLYQWWWFIWKRFLHAAEQMNDTRLRMAK